jgi:hypothetical protein
VLSLIATLERDNARLARENARLVAGEPTVEPVAAPPVEPLPVKRRDEDSGVFAVMFALYFVMKVLALIVST